MEPNRAEKLVETDSMTSSDACIADTHAAVQGQTTEAQEELTLRPLLAVCPTEDKRF